MGARKFAEFARGSINPKGKGKENMTTELWKVGGRMKDMIVFRRGKQEKKEKRKKNVRLCLFSAAEVEFDLIDCRLDQTS